MHTHPKSVRSTQDASLDHAVDTGKQASALPDKDVSGTALLKSLVVHSQAFQIDVLLHKAQVALNAAEIDFAAVLEEGKLAGILSRKRINQLMGSRSGIGFALYAKLPVRELMQTEFLRVPDGQPVTHALTAMIKRGNADFYEDVVLVDAQGAFLGFIPVHSLVHLQQRLLLDKIEQLDVAGEKLQRINHDLTVARDSALSAARAKSAFLACMSHEIRTPLNGIIGMVSLLQQNPLTEEQRDCFSTIQCSGQSLLAVLNDILDFSKIESGHLELELQPVDLEGCVLNCLHLFSPKAVEKGLELICRFDPSLPASIASDPTRLQQILCNLVGNAVKFCEHGEVLVDVRLEPAQHSGVPPAIRIEIHDTGIGMAEEKMCRLFLPFSQLDASTARRHGGTGLGLAICKRLVELMGGQIGVESQPGHGSTFWFRLPVKADDLAATSTIGPHTSLIDSHILLVERNTTCRGVLREILSRWGARISDVSTLEEFQALEPTLSQFDYVMVDASFASRHSQVVAACRRCSDLGRTKVAWMDHFGSATARDGARPDPKFNCLHKPLSRSALLQFLVPRADDIRPLLQQIPTHEAMYGRLRILVAEDNLVNQKVLTQMLKKLGCSADIAWNGTQAVSAALRSSYDLVFMDVQMPEMDGLEATRRLKKLLPRERHPWIIALTANAMTGDQEKCLAAGMDAYLSKPVVFPQLVSALEGAFSKRISPSAENELLDSVA